MRRCVVVQFNQRIPQKSTVSVVCFNFIDEIWGGLGGGGEAGCCVSRVISLLTCVLTLCLICSFNLFAEVDG